MTIHTLERKKHKRTNIYLYTLTQRYCIWSLGLRRIENESRVKVQSQYNVDKATGDIYIST